jgi:hypothetical protein
MSFAVPERVIAVEPHHPDRHRTFDSTVGNTPLDAGPHDFADGR